MPATAVPAAAAAGLASKAAPALPEGWRSLFPHPPQAPVVTWRYVPNAALVGVVQLSDKKLGYVESRKVALMVPVDGGELQASQAGDFAPDTFDHDPAPGASFAELGLFGGARAIKAREKQLRDLALATTRAVVFENAALELVSTPGETAQAFAERAAQVAAARRQSLRAEIMAKHDPRIQKLAMQRDAAQAELAQARASVPGAMDAVGAMLLGRGGVGRAMARSDKAQARIQKLTAKATDAEAALAEAVGKRNHELTTKEAALTAAPSATIERVVLPKKDALHVEGYAIVWVAR